MKNVMICLMFVFVMACGKNTETVKVVNSSAAVDPVAAIIQEENDYRLGLGQATLTEGLSCTLCTITGGQFILNDATHTPTLTGIATVATFLLTKEFNQPNSSTNDGLNVLPSALQSNPTYKNLIKLICQGQLVVTKTDYYTFDLTSDDGSLLYLDGARLIDNDGNHGSTTKSGTKYLRKGVHTFKLEFAQTGGGNQSLVLMNNGELVSASRFFH